MSSRPCRKLKSKDAPAHQKRPLISTIQLGNYPSDTNQRVGSTKLGRGRAQPCGSVAPIRRYPMITPDSGQPPDSYRTAIGQLGGLRGLGCQFNPLCGVGGCVDTRQGRRQNRNEGGTFTADGMRAV